jgi:hypothetical protein
MEWNSLQNCWLQTPGQQSSDALNAKKQAIASKNDVQPVITRWDETAIGNITNKSQLIVEFAEGSKGERLIVWVPRGIDAQRSIIHRADIGLILQCSWQSLWCQQAAVDISLSNRQWGIVLNTTIAVAWSMKSNY